MNCIICDKPISKKARTCSAKCKQIAYRNKKRSVTVTPVTLAPVTSPTVTDLEKCRYCSALLPKLSKPRRFAGACYECVLKHADRSKTAEDLWPDYRSQPLTKIA
jgi:hypothetical protein